MAADAERATELERLRASLAKAEETVAKLKEANRLGKKVLLFEDTVRYVSFLPTSSHFCPLLQLPTRRPVSVLPFGFTFFHSIYGCFYYLYFFVSFQILLFVLSS